jgi:hypothetical protein
MEEQPSITPPPRPQWRLSAPTITGGLSLKTAYDAGEGAAVDNPLEIDGDFPTCWTPTQPMRWQRWSVETPPQS